MGDISDNFSRYEMACKCGCGFDTVDYELIPILEKVRVWKGTGYSPTNVCRCIEHNEQVQFEADENYAPYSSKSQHLFGRAADIRDENPGLLYDFPDNLYPDRYGIGVYDWGVHIDTRTNGPARWDSRSKSS